MKPIYIMQPNIHEPIVLIKGKPIPRKRVKLSEVPPDYRKNRIRNFKNWLFDAKQDIISIFRKENYYV